eukprot:2453893-Rhodomonas_salina.2
MPSTAALQPGPPGETTRSLSLCPTMRHLTSQASASLQGLPGEMPKPVNPNATTWPGPRCARPELPSSACEELRAGLSYVKKRGVTCVFPSVRTSAGSSGPNPGAVTHTSEVSAVQLVVTQAESPISKPRWMGSPISAGLKSKNPKLAPCTVTGSEPARRLFCRTRCSSIG